jgi:hypothetical protein
MNKYETPDMDVIYFHTEDILTSSPSGPGQGEIIDPGWDD